MRYLFRMMVAFAMLLLAQGAAHAVSALHEFTAESAQLATQAATIENWIRRTPDNHPTKRHGHAMAYDSAREVVVFFGGMHSVSLPQSDTWEWNGTDWLLHSPANKPSARANHGMAYDSVRGVTVLFGGDDRGSAFWGDTWEWDGVDWTRQLPAAAPPARSGHAMAYDSAREVTVLFGGKYFSTTTNDTWEWNGVDWIQRLPAQQPPAQSGHAMAYDAGRGVTVMVGGGETWEWNGVDWTQHIPATNPPARAEHAMAYDNARAMTLLLGGNSGGTYGTYYDDTWEWDGVDWIQRLPTNQPAPRSAHAVAYDSAREVLVLFGGTRSWLPNYFTQYDDTWEYVSVPAQRVFLPLVVRMP